MAIHFQMGGTPSYTDFPFHNYGGSDIAAGSAVAVDSTNVVDGASKDGVGCMLPASAGDPVVGVTLETIKAGARGTVRCFGPIAQMTAGTGGTTAGSYVEANTDGTAIPYVTNHAALGIALTTSAATESCLVLLVGSPAQA